MSVTDNHRLNLTLFDVFTFLHTLYPLSFHEVKTLRPRCLGPGSMLLQLAPWEWHHNWYWILYASVSVVVSAHHKLCFHRNVLGKSAVFDDLPVSESENIGLIIWGKGDGTHRWLWTWDLCFTRLRRRTLKTFGSLTGYPEAANSITWHLGPLCNVSGLKKMHF